MFFFFSWPSGEEFAEVQNPARFFGGGACVQRCGGISRPKEGTGPAPWKVAVSPGSRGHEGPWQSRRTAVLLCLCFLNYKPLG